ncbi:MAG: spermidine/putrescine ABC transporter substrate-binding protein [bacterium]|nr:spermidine/putrescine ABC transporter substrate-binding protein [bacterium]MCP5030468.1 spermidine/putrescine ABC transporter substrate-binding protein [Actinomycetes bacterium]
MKPRYLYRLLAAVLALSLVAAACGDSDDDAAEQATCEVGETDGNLAIFNWAEYIDEEELDAFGAEFDVSVTMDTYDSNEAMQPIISAGNSGYDLIVPSDYMVTILIAAGAIQPLNRDAIPNLSNLSEDFTDLAYDPGGVYSAPYQWGTTGLAVNTAVVGTDFEPTWGLIFDPELAGQHSGQISLLNDPRETLGAALKYLGYSLNTTDIDELNEARDLISAARDNLAAFDTDQADELLVGGETVIAHGYSGDMFVQFFEADDPADFVYFVPQEGGARWVDTIALPFDAPHPCTAHTFINWLLSAEHGAALSNWNYYSTPNAAALELLDEELIDFITNPEIVVGGQDSLEQYVDTGDFEVNYSDAFTEAKG